jgi:CPA1 family monovalent cation:H+ antiporter
MSSRLKAIPLFAELGPRSLQRIAKLMTEFEAQPGDVLIQPGTAGSGLFLIEQGEVEAQLRTKKAVMGAGEFFGELALLDDRSRRSARVRARTSVRGYVVDRAGFQKLLETEPKVSIAMLKVLARRLIDNTSL